MRAGRLGEWQFLAHDGAYRAIFEPRNESSMDFRLFGRRPYRNPKSAFVGKSAVVFRMLAQLAVGVEENLKQNAIDNGLARGSLETLGMFAEAYDPIFGGVGRAMRRLQNVTAEHKEAVPIGAGDLLRVEVFTEAVA
jgi:hypothetical protein